MDLFTSEAWKEAWEEWLQFRKERKLAKYTPTGLKKTMTHLRTISNGDESIAIQIINQSIAQNYQGLHPLKINHVQPKQLNTSNSNGHEQLASSILNDLQQGING